MAFTQVIKTLGSVMASMKTAVDTWLSQNITNPSNPPLDRSLSLSNACAPADMVGDLKSAFNTFKSNTFEIIEPTDYGALIKAEDCWVSKANVLTLTDTEDGILITKTGRDNVSVYFYFNDLPTASAANPITYDFSITVSDTTGIDAVYFYDGSTLVGSYSGGTISKDGNTYSFTYTYPNQSKLRWQIGLLYSFQSTKMITSITGVIHGATDEYRIISDTIQWYMDERFAVVFNAPNNGIKELKSFNGELWSQGACAVGNYYVGFNAGADDHSTTGIVTIGLFSDMPNNTDNITQNLGHCASADYDENTDTMLVGNGTSDTTIPPVLYLVKGASEVVANKTNIAYNGSNVVAIELTGLGGGGCVACFGENSDIVYVVTVDTETQWTSDSNTKTIYRCFMGKGTNNLVSSYPSDSKGTFISGCSDNEYNGTLRIMDEYEIKFSGELQGLKYVNGNLVLPTDNYKNRDMRNNLTSYLLYLKLQDTPMIEKILWVPVMASDGGLIRTECEDVIFHNGVGYVMTITTVGSTHVYKTHVFRE